MRMRGFLGMFYPLLFYIILHGERRSGWRGIFGRTRLLWWFRQLMIDLRLWRYPTWSFYDYSTRR